VFGVFLNYQLRADSVQRWAIFLAMIFYSMIISHYSMSTSPAYPSKIYQETGKESMVILLEDFLTRNAGTSPHHFLQKNSCSAASSSISSGKDSILI
jgi:hypothetical protein